MRYITILLTALFLTACSSSMQSKMQDLSFGMTQDQVRDVLGSDYEVVAASMNKEGKPVQGWKYQNSDKDPAYMVYFVNGKLAQWGNAAALQSIPDLGEPQ